ncbi:lathosterol oxidase isoform X3 [Equus asinus]|uniref:lathosterol oxidase isoform X3 n=1 Tax=Equus asinus TaxID=9793 RepID=UPI0038F67049
MDLVLSAADYYFFTPYIYPATWPEDDIFRQTISLLIVTNLGAYILYFLFSTLNYYFVFDHALMKHPQFLKNQVYREIMFAVQSLPWISIPTILLFLLELRGYSKLYDDVGEFPSGWFHLVVSVLSFLFFTDMLIYWIHRGLHHRLVYKDACSWFGTVRAQTTLFTIGLFICNKGLMASKFKSPILTSLLDLRLPSNYRLLDISPGDLRHENQRDPN